MIAVNSRFLTQKITGVQRFAIELSIRLKSLSEEFVFVAPNNICLKEEAKVLNVKIIGTHTGHLWEQYDLPRWLKQNGNPLLLNLANTAPLLYSNKVSTIHDVAFEVYPNTFSKSFLYFYKFLIPRVVKTSKRIITVSEFSKKEVVKYYSVSSDIVDVVYNSVNDTFAPTKGKNEGKYFLAVSSLNYRKNFIYILRAFEKYQKDDTSAMLYVVGDIRSKSFGKVDLSQYQNNDHIRFMGRVTDKELIDLYTKAQCFIYPSLYEGFGLPPLEAQACGCPTICSDIACLQEVFGNSVLYCDPYNTDSLVGQMKKISIDDELKRCLLDRGRENLKKYSWDDSAGKLYSIISGIK